jgi:AmmeMemoRadiSam system protein B
MLKALIGPHAGFTFSGPNAAWAYKAIDANAYDRVFILGPSHKVFLDFIATTACSHWNTPLGSLKVDHQIIP